jgi:hypothetical protein
MGCDPRANFIAGPCPGCGATDAARMGSSSWEHGLMCCSNACGIKVRDALNMMREDERHKFFVAMGRHAREQLGYLQTEYLSDLRERNGGGRR